MRRFSFAALATVSLAALLSSAVPVLAKESADLGILKSVDKWRIGTVKADGNPYCAAVNKFDSNVVLAIARDINGYNSIAVNFDKNYFSSAQDYSVALNAAGRKKGYPGKSTSEKSFAVDVGQDDSIIGGANISEPLKVSMPVVTATFAMKDFEPAFKQLVDCADKLKGADAGKMAEATNITAPLQKDAPAASAGSSLDAMETEMDAKGAPKAVAAASGDLPPPPSAQPPRKLLASMGSATEKSMTAPVAPSAGTTAQALERQQVAALESKKTAVISAPPEKTESKPVELVNKTAAVEKAPAPAPDSEMKKTAPVMASAALLGLPTEGEKVPAAPAKPVTAQALSPAPGDGALANRLAQSEAGRADLARQLDDLREKNKKTEAAIAEKQHQLEGKSQDATAKAALEKQMAELKAQNDSALAGMQKSLDAKTAEMNALKQELDAQKAQQPQEIAQLKAQNAAALDDMKRGLDAKTTEINDLKQKLDAQKTAKPEEIAALQAQNNAALEDLKKDLNAKTAEIDNLKKELEAQKSAAKPEDIAAVKAETNAALDKMKQDMAAKTAEIATLRAQMDAQKASADLPPPIAAPVTPVERSVMAAAPVPATPVEQAIVTAAPAAGAPAAADTMTPEETNAASAFLDRIMTYHHGGKPASAPKARGWSASGVKPAVTKSAVVNDNPVVAAPVPAPPAVQTPAPAPVPVPVQAVSAPLPPPPPVLNNVPSQAPLKTVMSQPPAPSVAPAIQAAAPPVVAAAPIPAGPVTLDALVGHARPGAEFVPTDANPGEIVRQWKSGKVNGMYEQTAGKGDFGAQAQNYISRYRDDCPGQLNVSLDKPKSVAAGTISTGTLSCAMPGNSYTMSVVFLQDGGQFNAFMNTAQPAAAAEVTAAGADLAQSLSRAPSFKAPVTDSPILPTLSPDEQAAMPSPMESGMPLQVTAPPVAVFAPPPTIVSKPVSAAPSPMKFNIRTVPGASSTSGDGQELDTVIIQ